MLPPLSLTESPFGQKSTVKIADRASAGNRSTGLKKKGDEKNE